ncbi:MAG: ATP-binding protein [Chlamydiales bacterium]
MKNNVVGRQEEKKLLTKRLLSKEPEFIAVHGRRRVGKTFLIKHCIEELNLNSMVVTGLKDGTHDKQLEIFKRAFEKTFLPIHKLASPENWIEAFDQLTKQIDQLPKKKPFVIFLDELPWLATAKSGLLQAIDHFWNTEWVHRENIKLIACGSAASWIIDNLINAKGGLHNRLTASILLKPFNIQETKEFFVSRSIRMNLSQILDIYLVMGGIPHYLKALDKGLSAMQNINQLCFTANGLLYNEFDRLFSSLFKNSEAYLEIVQILAKQPQGTDQQTLEKILKLSASGGTLTKRLAALEAAGFIISFIPYGREKKGIYYRIIDEYTLFYLKWVKPVSNRIKLASSQSNYWQSKSQSAHWKSWVGFAFEAFCYKHIEQIVKALKIQSGFTIGTWRYTSKKEKGVQIDLLLDCDDNVIYVFEIKYSQKPYRITKQYATELCDKIDIFKEQLNVKKDIYLAMLTSTGLFPNSYVDDLVNCEVTLKDIV